MMSNTDSVALPGPINSLLEAFVSFPATIPLPVDSDCVSGSEFDPRVSMGSDGSGDEQFSLVAAMCQNQVKAAK